MRACCATNGIRKRNLFGCRKCKESFVTDQFNASFGHCPIYWSNTVVDGGLRFLTTKATV